MPILIDILPYFFTVIFVFISACLVAPLILLLVVAVIWVDKRFCPPNTMFIPPNEGDLITASGVPMSSGVHARMLRDLGREGPRRGYPTLSANGSSIPLDMGASG